jgi:hypothetical protein
MKRLAAAGTFALIGGAVTLLLLASILFSCGKGGHPHDMGTQSWTPASDAPPTVASAPVPDPVSDTERTLPVNG